MQPGISQPQYNIPAQNQYNMPAQPGYQQQPNTGEFMTQQASQFLMNPDAIQMVGNQAFSMGQQFVQQQKIGGWFNWNGWKPYWDVNHSFVMGKLGLLLFPFRHKQWSRSAFRSEMNGQAEGWKSPRNDINAPDLYIPTMAYVTYILFMGILLGIEKRFKPEVLTITASSALFFTTIEVLFLRLGFYILDINMNESRIHLADLVSYCGYKFVTIIFIQMISVALKSPLVTIIAFMYAAVALGWFLLRSLRYILLSSGDMNGNSMANPTGTAVRKRRVYFLFLFALFEIFSVWWLIK